jgi:hypothetical protein
VFQRDEDFPASWPTDDEWRVTEVWPVCSARWHTGVEWRVTEVWPVCSASWHTGDEWRVTEMWPAVLCQLIHGWWMESNRSVTSCTVPADTRYWVESNRSVTSVLCQLTHGWRLESNRKCTQLCSASWSRAMSEELPKIDQRCSASWPTYDEWRVTEVWPAVLCQLIHGWWAESNRSVTSCAQPADPRVMSGE